MSLYEQLRENEKIKTYIERADSSLCALGYTEHSFAHVTRVAETAYYILKTLGYSEHICDLARSAGYLHDIGNLVNRTDHSQSGAVMAFRILDNMGVPAEDIADIVCAIGNHDEGTGVPVNAIAAALILADKADVRSSRVRNSDPSTFDIHDRVNYSVKKSELLPGDLVLFNTYGSGIGHVGIYVGDGNMVHAPYSGQRVRVETINSGYYASTYVGARRIF